MGWYQYRRLSLCFIRWIVVSNIHNSFSMALDKTWPVNICEISPKLIANIHECSVQCQRRHKCRTLKLTKSWKLFLFHFVSHSSQWFFLHLSPVVGFLTEWRIRHYMAVNGDLYHSRICNIVRVKGVPQSRKLFQCTECYLYWHSEILPSEKI